MNLGKKRLKDFVKYFSWKTIEVLVFDAVIISFSFLLAVVIKNDLTISYDIFITFLIEIPIIIGIYWIVFELFQMYRSLWQFAGIEEIVKGVTANAVATVSSYFLVGIVLGDHLFGSYYVIAFFIITFNTLFSRVFYKVFGMTKTLFENKLPRKKALIVGAGGAGVLVFDELAVNTGFDSQVVGFIDDEERKMGKLIHGVPVIGTTFEIDLKILELDIDIVYVAIPQAGKVKISEVLNLIAKTGAQIKLFPPFYEVLQGAKDEKLKLRDVNIADLLGREPIVLEEEGIKEYIDSKTILVTGGGGSIGSELCRQLRSFNPAKIIIVDIYENNAYDLQMEFESLYRTNIIHKPEIIVLIASVRDEQRINEIFKEYKPNVVFHAAAHKHVPLMEFSPKEAIKNNVFGTYNVAKLADKHSVEIFVLISTDKAVNPTNVMGATKRYAEKIIMEINTNSKTEFAAVRFGNVLGSNGSVIPLFKKQIENGGPVTVTHKDIIRYFMTIAEACQLVIQAGAFAKGGELFILDMGDQIKIIDLAEKLIRLSGFEPYKDIKIEFTGLRPGEKMYEELLVDYKKTTKTNNNKIFVEPNIVFNENIIDKLDIMRSLIVNSSTQMVISKLKEQIETYKES